MAFRPSSKEHPCDSLYQYIEDITKIALITPEKEIELATRIAAGDHAAKKEMIEANLRLVICIARRYNHRGIALPDLVEEGNLGLIHAVEKFDPSHGARFSTYATWWIRQAMDQAIMNQARMVRIPVHMMKKFKRYRRAVINLQHSLEREPTFKEIADHLELPLQQIDQFVQYDKSEVSLDNAINDAQNLFLHDSLSDPNETNPADILQSEQFDQALGQAIRVLDPSEREILNKRFGTEGETLSTLENIGTEKKITRETVRQIQLKTLRDLKKNLKSRGVF